MEGLHRLAGGNGSSIAYRLWRSGEQQRPLIVLLHGMASNLTRWSEFLEHTTLKDSWDILRLDLRGHGESMSRDPLNMEIWYQDLLRILDTETRSQALLIGHSLGAQLAINFAARYPARVTGLVLIDPILGRPSTRTVRLGHRLRHGLRLLVMIIRVLNRLGLRRRHIPKRDLRKLDQQMRETLLATGKPEEIVNQYSSPWPDLKHFPTANFVQEMIEMIRPLPALSGITAPVLVILSKGGTYADPAVSQQMIAQFKNAKTVEIDAYHWPLTEKPKEVRVAIENWCTALRTRHSALSP